MCIRDRAEGGRLFDHNRVRDDLGNYLLSAPGLAIEADGRACPAPVGPSRAQLVFAADWSETRQGVLTPGGEVAVVYDPARPKRGYILGAANAAGQRWLPGLGL